MNFLQDTANQPGNHPPMPGVREPRTYAVMEEVKSTTRLPLA